MTEKRLAPAKSRGARTPAERAALELERPPRSPAEVDARRVGRRHGSDSGAALGEIAEALGHVGGRVVPTVRSGRWFAMCSCGYVSATRNTERDGLEALMHHVSGAIREWHRSGLPLSAARPQQPDWDAVGKRSPHYAAWSKACAAELAEERAGASLGVSPLGIPRAV